MTTAASPPDRPVHYAWIVAGVVFVTMLGAAGIRSAPGVLMVPLEKDFGWTRTTVSLAVSVNLVLFGLMGRLPRPWSTASARAGSYWRRSPCWR